MFLGVCLKMCKPVGGCYSIDPGQWWTSWPGSKDAAYQHAIGAKQRQSRIYRDKGTHTSLIMHFNLSIYLSIIYIRRFVHSALSFLVLLLVLYQKNILTWFRFDILCVPLSCLPAAHNCSAAVKLWLFWFPVECCCLLSRWLLTSLAESASLRKFFELLSNENNRTWYCVVSLSQVIF